MHSVEEVLTALSARLEPASLSEALGRILRVPAAWQQLHEPDFLSAFRAAALPAELTPAHLASLAMGGELGVALGPQHLGDWAEPSRQAWEAFVDSTGTPQDLPQLALLGLEFMLQADLAPALEMAMQSPARWQDVLAVAWLGHPQRDQILSALLADAGAAGKQLAAHIALANLKTAEAAQRLASACPPPCYGLVRCLQDMGEASAAALLLEAAPPPTGSTPVDHLWQAEHSLAAGRPGQAYQSLQVAWESASGAAAEVADRMARYALGQGDPVLAAEAARRALENLPTPERRATHALSLSKLGRAHESQTSLSSASPSAEERIVLGMGLADQGQPTEARAALESVVEEVSRGAVIKDHWLQELTLALEQAGAVGPAVQVALARAERSPLHAEARRTAVRLLEASGDPEGAARQAQLAVSFDPSSQEDRSALAKNLVGAGEAAAAMPHWEILVSAGGANTLELAACALAAGQIDAAQAHCTKVLEADPGSTEASTLLARCLTARKDIEAAEARLREVVGAHPGYVEARLALAEALAAGGQDQSAGEVLFASVQALPHELQLNLALARWLRTQDRPSEAVQVAKSGLQAGLGPVEALIEFGEASLEIGEWKPALQALSQAAERQPGNWRARLGLARAYERSGDQIRAAEYAGGLPKAAPAEAYLHAARITILAAEVRGAPEQVQAAVDQLRRAASKSPGDPRIELWAGRAHEVAGRHAKALETYQACLARFASEDAASYGEALLGIGRSAIATGELSLALSTLEQAQKRFPASSEILCLLSHAYGSANLPEKAVQAAERAVDINGRHPGAWKTLGRSKAALGDLAGALQAYQGWSAVEPADPEGWMELARLAQAAQSSEVTRKALAEALWRGRNAPQVLAQSADLLESMGSPHSALRMLRIAGALNPDDRPTLTRLAELSGQLGRLETAHQAWSRVAELEPDNPTAYRKSADALWGLGQPREAIQQWQRALDLDPQNPDVRRALGRATMQIGEVQNALNHYSAAIELSPRDPSLPLEAGVAAMRRGSMQEAAGLLSDAVERDPSSAEAWAALGECSVQLGEWNKAEVALSRANDLGAGVAALRVLTALGMGDLGSAVPWLEQAMQSTPAEPVKAVWTARALLRMAHWSEAIQVLKSRLEGSEDPSVRQTLAEMRITLAEAGWILKQAGADTSGPESALREAAAGPTGPALSLESLRLREQVVLQPVSQASLNALQGLVQRQPDGAAAQSLAIGWMRAGQPEAALRALESPRSASYEFDWRPLLQAAAHRQLDRPEEALEALEVGAQDPVLRPLTEALEGAIQTEIGRRDAAIAAWNRALAARPQEASWHYALAGLYLEGGELDVALPHLQQAVEQAPGAMDYRMQLARTLAACGHGTEAVASFKLVMDRAESSVQDLLDAGEVALATQSAEQAHEWFERAHGLAPQDPRGLVGSARAAMALGKGRKARVRIEAALRAAPNDPEVRLGQGEILAMQRDYRAALQAYEQVRGLSGAAKSRLIQAKSQALMALGQSEQAEQGLLAELEQASQDPSLWFPLALVRESKGDLASAAEAAGQAVRLAPLNPDYRLGLARICRRSGNLDRALDELVRARELAPADPRVPLEQGVVYEERRDYRRALESYRRAIELDNRTTQAFYRSGLVLKVLKAYPQAGQMLKRAAELAPVDRDVMHQLAAVRALELVHGPAAGAVH